MIYSVCQADCPDTVKIQPYRIVDPSELQPTTRPRWEAMGASSARQQASFQNMRETDAARWEAIATF